MPEVALATTSGGEPLRLDRLPPGLTLVFVYPHIGIAEGISESGWNAIPGARGCTPEACGFRDHERELRDLGASIIGASSQALDEQREAVQRHGLGYPLASDPEMELSTTLGLPSFETGGHRFYRRLTLVVRDGVVEHVFYPVFPPDRHAAAVVAWLAAGGVRNA